MYRAFELSGEQDLSEFSRLLWQKRISHIIRPHGDRQTVFVADPQRVEEAASLFVRWQQGDVIPEETDSRDVASWISPGGLLRDLLLAFARTPLTLVTVAVCIVLAVLTLNLGNRELFEALLYPDFAFGGRTIYLQRVLDSFSLRDLLNMISPILLHGGYVHLAFNMLWFWEFGKRIEAVQSTWWLLGIIVATALVSNTTQYLLGGGNNFVGMSGVVYGLLAWIWMWQVIDPRRGLGLPMGLIIVMIIALALLTMVDLAVIANEAHIAGLLAGLVLGGITAFISRIRRNSVHGNG